MLSRSLIGMNRLAVRHLAATAVLCDEQAWHRVGKKAAAQSKLQNESDTTAKLKGAYAEGREKIKVGGWWWWSSKAETIRPPRIWPATSRTR